MVLIMNIYFPLYNNFGTTERSIEIPIIEYFLDHNTHEEILEIGNVSFYYYSRFINRLKKIDVVDKIEQGIGVITSDIAKYEPKKKYDFIFSISTFEHMDSDRGRNKDYIPGIAKHETVAMDNIFYCYNSLLMNGGMLVITALLSYTNEWDETFIKISNYSSYFLNMERLVFKRVNEFEWEQLNSEQISHLLKLKNIPFNKYLSVLSIKK